MLTFDICKAFLGIELPETDQNKLLCLWFKSVKDGDFSLISYRNKRLSFGLRCSPAILVLALYKMLIMDIDNDSDEVIGLKKLTYDCIYMDNGCITSNDPNSISWAFKKLQEIFKEYRFSLLQFSTNLTDLQIKVDISFDSETGTSVKYFGMEWNRFHDTLSPGAIKLNPEAKTKRSILSTLNSVFDIFNVYGPILNRAKLFFQKLQLNKTLNWDSDLSSSEHREWVKITRQVNSCPTIELPRKIGSSSSSYDLVAFSDASASIYGVVVYLVDTVNLKSSFLCAKNKLVNPNQAKRTIPSLECQGVCYAVEVIIDIFKELCGPQNISCVNIKRLHVYTDSLVCLSWIRAFFHEHSKMQKRSTFVLNRLDQIGRLSKTHEILFKFVEGRENPADMISRPTSYKQLHKSNYFVGPKYLTETDHQPDIVVVVPNPSLKLDNETFNSPVQCCKTFVHTPVSCVNDPLVNPERFSKLSRLINVCRIVLKFVNILKCRILSRDGESKISSDSELLKLAHLRIIHDDQRSHFPEIFEYFAQRSVPCKNIPNLVLQMNLFVDKFGIIRVKGKMRSGVFPMLLPSRYKITSLLVTKVHENLMHAGLFSTLRELRKDVWILRGYSTVKRIIKGCMTCRKLNERPVRLNQNSYPEFRFDPPSVPFAAVALDHFGPYEINLNGAKVKSYVLIITCLWSRAVNLKICYSLNVAEFLRALQSHVYEYGLFSFCLTDLGSQIVAGGKIVTEFLSDEDTKKFFTDQGIKPVSFQHYAKGNSSLGSLVENLVKQCKRLIAKTIGKNILPFAEFQLFIDKAKHIINRRPIAFKESLRDSCASVTLPVPITPENLLRGFDVNSFNIIPQLQSSDTIDDPDFNPVETSSEFLRESFIKLRKVSNRLRRIYHTEFLTSLMYQSIDRKNRYTPVLHKSLGVGDIVLLVEPQFKQHNYPMGIVKEIEENSLGEVTAAKVFKGITRELVYRHASSLILLMQNNFSDSEQENSQRIDDSVLPKRERIRRSASGAARRKIGLLSKEELL